MAGCFRKVVQKKGFNVLAYDQTAASPPRFFLRGGGAPPLYQETTQHSSEVERSSLFLHHRNQVGPGSKGEFKPCIAKEMVSGELWRAITSFTCYHNKTK